MKMDQIKELTLEQNTQKTIKSDHQSLKDTMTQNTNKLPLLLQEPQDE